MGVDVDVDVDIDVDVDVDVDIYVIILMMTVTLWRFARNSSMLPPSAHSSKPNFMETLLDKIYWENFDLERYRL